jgi:hypothetical protein
MTYVPTGYRLFCEVRDEIGPDALRVALETGKKLAVEWDKESGRLHPMGEDFLAEFGRGQSD